MAQTKNSIIVPRPAPEDIPYGHCHCGCGQKTTIRTKNHTKDRKVKGEPALYVRGHSRRMTPVDYVPNPETGCWEWSGYKDPQGYCRMMYKGKKALVHRAYWEMHRGPIPEGMTIDHICRVRHCVNPDHLRVVTLAVNSQETNRRRLSDEDIRRIRSLWPAMNQSEIARLYDTVPSHISRIVRRETWKDRE
jgi:hypothetical protein